MKVVVFAGLCGWLLLAALPGRAQTPGTGGPEPQDEPTTVPLDAAAGLLLATGLGYGLRRLRARRASH